MKLKDNKIARKMVPFVSLLTNFYCVGWEVVQLAKVEEKLQLK